MWLNGVRKKTDDQPAYIQGIGSQEVAEKYNGPGRKKAVKEKPPGTVEDHQKRRLSEQHSGQMVPGGGRTLRGEPEDHPKRKHARGEGELCQGTKSPALELG